MIFHKILLAIVLSHFLMLGVFYAYREEYKHNDCFFYKPSQYVYKISNFKMSVTRMCRYDCCEVNAFFLMFS